MFIQGHTGNYGRLNMMVVEKLLSRTTLIFYTMIIVGKLVRSTTMTVYNKRVVTNPKVMAFFWQNSDSIFDTIYMNLVEVTKKFDYGVLTTRIYY